MFGRVKNQDQPRGKLSNWLNKVFGKKEVEPNAEAFSLDGPETAEVDMRNESRMTEKYQEYLRKQEEKWAQEAPAAEEKPVTIPEEAPVEKTVPEEPATVMPGETDPEETVPVEAEAAISGEAPFEEPTSPVTEKAPDDSVSDPAENA